MWNGGGNIEDGTGNGRMHVIGYLFSPHKERLDTVIKSTSHDAAACLSHFKIFQNQSLLYHRVIARIPTTPPHPSLPPFLHAQHGLDFGRPLSTRPCATRHQSMVLTANGIRDDNGPRSPVPDSRWGIHPLEDANGIFLVPTGSLMGKFLSHG